MHRCLPRLTLVLALPLIAGTARAADNNPPETVLPPTEVIGVTPILGSGIDRDKVPANPRSFTPNDLERNGTPDLAGTLEQRVPSVNTNGVQNSPFQPDIQYRGFDASPVLGTPQGLAVYQNGVRINEAFGDTVNWDLVPDFAVNRVNLTGANPVFGLNALGGALALEMKNGFNFQGGEAEISGGSFGRIEGTAQYGQRFGNFATYIGTHQLSEEGWR
ncbi:MAG TPA: Plug domain-containing protein, partial [Stellaceae bacterium]|nr:Plug domain-containing protein [Stellaceae bacterium]